MLLELIAQYYKYLLLALGAVAFLKIMISLVFNGSLEGLNGIIFALFKWYGEEEQEMEDIGRRRMFMRVHNLITVLLYVIILAIIVATLLPMALG